MDALTSEQLDQSYDRFFQAQPHLLQFLVRLTGDHDRIHELVMHLSFLVFKSYEAEYPGEAVTVKREDFEAVWNQARSWIAQFFSPHTTDDHVETEPILLTYFINLLETPLKDGTQYTASEQRDVLFVVKTVMLALEQAAKRQD